MRICIISDTHELHREIEIPPCEALISCGDFSFFGRSTRAMDDFNEWLGDQPAQYRIITCGNHEFPVEVEPDKWRKRMSNATLLLNESVTIEGVKLWASPVTSVSSGAFAMPDEADRGKLYSTIPTDTDILMTHGPPLNVLDGGQGCPALRRAVIRVKPKLHCFGHVHSAYGTMPTNNTLFVNASILDDSGAPSRNPVLLDLKI